MRLIFGAVILVSFCCFIFGSDAKSVLAGSKVFVEASDGFDNYLAAALQKKKVSVVIVADKDKADYELQGVSDHQKAGWAKVVFMGQIHSDVSDHLKT
jgi:hypothetical protein